MLNYIRSIAGINSSAIAAGFELIPVIDYSLRKLEQCTNLLVPNLFKSNKRIALDNITPILKNLAIAGSLYRQGTRESLSGKDYTEVVYILSKELLCLSYLSEQYIKTLINININVDPVKSHKLNELSTSKGISSEETENELEERKADYSFRAQ